MKSRFNDYSAIARSMGLQPGEDYGESEECHTCITQHTFSGTPFEVFYDEMASPLSQWKAFACGIGTMSGMERENVIAEMRKAIAIKNGVTVKPASDQEVRQSVIPDSRFFSESFDV